ncbi:Wadjet anti-phage system protein JetD domain-containing protein [Paratractidigestivibacter faecalis]|uniref:Wadjet anti-phage system protein JetD domain-containing protein n=1 Tax=Paratractidigestivibacter faecalis TaxID=2292441 RepID=UPI000E3E83FC|nr:Wadjet anti-phage system protein JetD domain-containing protein [Paratractidigestivibacter faecalis]
MARKLSLQERESINYITDVLCHALPAAQRSFAGSLASALVRVKGDQVTDADLVRATEKFGEYQSALIEVAKAKVLDRVPAVDAKGDGEAFTLRVPESLGEAASEPEDAAAEASAAGEKPAEPSEEAATEPAEKKPARRRRTRRKKAAEPEGEAEVAKAAAAEVEAAPVAEPEPQAEDAVEAVGPEPEPEAKKKSVRPGRGARAARAKAKAEAAEKAAEAKEDAKGKKAALPAAKEAPALPEAAAAAAEPEAEAVSAAGEAAPEAAPEASSAPAKEAPKKRTRRRRTKKPVEDIVVKGPEAERLLAKEAAAVEAEAAGEAVATEATTEQPPVAAETDAVANEPQAEALLAEKGDAAEVAPEVAEEPAAEPAAAEPADAPAAEVTAEPAADEQSNGRSGGRARVRGRGRRGLERRSRGDNLSDVPYVRRGGESETALREQIVQLDPRLWMNGWLLSHPGAFTLYERELRGIDAALQEGELPGDLTRRQLAYKMGGNEKFFEYGADGHKLLRAMGADDLIGHRLVPKADMLYHVPRRRKSMKILVTENLDPWLDVRDLMYEDGRSLILGERVHGVVLGGGNPVIENNRLSGLLETLGAETIEVLYWGDIDRAGLNLLQRLQAMLEGRYKVTPFMPAYRLMLERAMERYPDPDQNERTTQENVEVQDFSSMLEGLSDEQAAYFSSIIQKCGLIPQEILTKQDL